MTTSSHQGNATRYAGTSAQNAMRSRSATGGSGTDEISLSLEQFLADQEIPMNDDTRLFDTLLVLTTLGIILITAVAFVALAIMF